jgi:serine/threonine protein kinase
MINKRLQRSKDNLSNYKLYNVIGRGAFGEVRLGRNIATSISFKYGR